MLDLVLHSAKKKGTAPCREAGHGFPWLRVRRQRGAESPPLGLQGGYTTVAQVASKGAALAGCAS